QRQAERQLQELEVRHDPLVIGGRQRREQLVLQRKGRCECRGLGGHKVRSSTRAGRKDERNQDCPGHDTPYVRHRTEIRGGPSHDDEWKTAPRSYRISEPPNRKHCPLERTTDETP